MSQMEVLLGGGDHPQIESADDRALADLIIEGLRPEPDQDSEPPPGPTH